jgi:hypothetical protein
MFGPDSGLNPKITVWTDKADKSMDTIRELGRAVVPMLDTIETQTGYKLPNWMLEHQQMQTQSSEAQATTSASSKTL